MKYKVTDVEKINYDTTRIRLEGPKLDFKPGQFVMISWLNQSKDPKQLPTKRAYSISSSPTKDYLEISVREVKKGFISKELQKIKVGTELELTGPFGPFYFDETKDKDTVMIGCGCGIMPFNSMLTYITEKKLPTKVKFFSTHQKAEDIAYRKEFEEIEKNNPNIKLYFSITKDPDNKDPKLRKGRIDKKYLQENIKSIEGKTFLICGTISFAKAMVGILRELGVKDENIKKSAHG
ncbi:MAG: FAD-dependent oxidoreductase [archaeon]|nr:FAD-dependent oxidoreductase [Nanoarchaeota archaeon]